MKLLSSLDSAGELRFPRHIHSSLNQFRRICPGRHFADLVLWAAIVSILSTVRIAPVKDSEGMDIPVIPEYANGIVMLVGLYRYFRQS